MVGNEGGGLMEPYRNQCTKGTLNPNFVMRLWQIYHTLHRNQLLKYIFALIHVK